MTDSGNHTVDQLQPVVAIDRIWLVGEAAVVERPELPIAAAISGKHPPGSIRPMRGWGEPHDQQASGAATEIGNWASPIIPVLKCSTFLLSDVTAVLN